MFYVISIGIAYVLHLLLIHFPHHNGGRNSCAGLIMLTAVEASCTKLFFSIRVEHITKPKMKSIAMHQRSVRESYMFTECVVARRAGAEMQ